MRVVVSLSVAATSLAAVVSYFLLIRRRRRQRPVRVVIVFSGKRKSGKDFCSDALLARFAHGLAEIGRLSGPLKHAYASEHGLDYGELLAATDYKERYRRDMISWGEERRTADPGYFASLVLAAARAPILIVSDARRATDVAFFKERVPTVISVRVVACTPSAMLLLLLLRSRYAASLRSDETRGARGWHFVEGIDDAESECGLDGYQGWDFVVVNEPDRKAKTDAMLAAIVREASVGCYY
ncbi:hypothetical protein CTAYLR_007381 [Chrysophaeum taylorii]|uniref:Phosphomevalonate kinase n=1 Tax=Chrysophaeum taylorii TaxID=2483200 RepID=A0AAD7XHB1_9STRA|nr:hypothetical protein CTAYLR_007381 [Chrysophaeum taylorii]